MYYNIINTYIEYLFLNYLPQTPSSPDINYNQETFPQKDNFTMKVIKDYDDFSLSIKEKCVEIISKTKNNK